MPKKKVAATQLGLLGKEFEQDYHLTKKGWLMPLRPSTGRKQRAVNRVEAPEAFRHKPKGGE